MTQQKPKAPALKPVKSSNVDGFHYDPASGSLHVKFKTGKTYEYTGVKPQDVEALTKADSFGSHMSKHIIPKFKVARSY
jgi:KTSC domain